MQNNTTEAYFVRQLERSYRQDGYFTRKELGVGHGIADLVLFKPNRKKIRIRLENNQHVRLLNENYFKVLSVIPDVHKNSKPACIQSINEKISVSRALLKYELIPKLKRAGYIKEIEKDLYLKINGWLPISREIIAIEAKLSNWKRGLYQAIRYKSFSDKVYLAVPPEIIKNISLCEFKKHNVGLVSFDQKSKVKKVVFNTKSYEPKNKNKRDYAAEHFWVSEIKKETIVV